MKTNLKYQIVMSEHIPASSPRGLYDIELSFDNNKQEPKKPFKLIIDGETLKIDGEEILFKKYYFALKTLLRDERILILKTINNKTVVLIKEFDPGGAKFKLFSSDGVSIFDEVYRPFIPTSNYHNKTQDFHLVFTNLIYSHYDWQKWSGGYVKVTSLYKFSTNRWGEVTEIAKELPIMNFNIMEIFGAFPLSLGNEKIHRRFIENHASWIALCSDDRYRMFYSCGYEIKWVLNGEGKILAIKTFLPTLRPNYFYFLTEENQEHVLNLTDCSQGMFNNTSNNALNKDRRLSCDDEAFHGEICFFLGKKHDQGFINLQALRRPEERLPTIVDFTSELALSRF